MFFYPVLTLYNAGIQDILLITSPEYSNLFEKTYSALCSLAPNIVIDTAVQDKPRGIADAFNICRNFTSYLGNITLILGDNIFFGNFNLKEVISGFKEGAHVWAYSVPDPSSYGVISLKDNKVSQIVEKPDFPESDKMVPGLYVYDKEVFEIVKNLQPSARGELEITDVNNDYISKGKMKASVIPPTVRWWDCGDHESLMNASNYIRRRTR